MNDQAPQKIAIILGGGITPDGQLTQLSIQRLDAGMDVYKDKTVDMLLVLGGFKSTYLPNSIEFKETAAQKRSTYLIAKGIPETSIIKVEAGRDTIGEALACRDFLEGTFLHHIILVTSDKHMPRAAWIFQYVLGENYFIQQHNVECGNILLEDEEKEYLQTTRDYLNGKNMAVDTDTWHANNPELYALFKMIHDKYHPKGKESQAYFAVTDNIRNEP